jgi:CRP-like cAMP-binding protein
MKADSNIAAVLLPDDQRPLSRHPSEVHRNPVHVAQPSLLKHLIRGPLHDTPRAHQHDGRRQIGAFYMPGEVFGFEAGEEHAFSAEAIVDCKVLVIKRNAIISLAARDSEVAHQLWTMTAAELRRAQGHVMLLIKTAQERVAAFLLEIAKRSSATTEINLPMSRQDIADYLGLTIETVSRTLTQLENSAAIAIPSSRHIVLRNRAALARLNA